MHSRRHERLIAGLKRVALALSECPTPTKVCFPSRKKARRRARQIGLTPYQCPCGQWHLTSTLGKPEPEDDPLRCGKD